MGRFETTAQTYAAHREPYPPEFFSAVAGALKLDGREALIDLGTGPGLLALGFAPYVGRIVGVDPEPAMIAEARRAAAAARVEFRLLEGRAEDVPANLGPFDLVTIGRALHWLDRDAGGLRSNSGAERPHPDLRREPVRRRNQSLASGL
ncbi:MAG TPA: class I SAM-dependent methyltransferase [Stellaceae bacterium]|nr:class I SAM-dependent methyltransferase [Stellaceae bacterium]